MLYDKLKMYSESGVYPFHMPGHKRNPMLCDGIMPYEIDLTAVSYTHLTLPTTPYV